MKWLITLVVGVALGAAGVLFFLSKVPINAPPTVVLAPQVPMSVPVPVPSPTPVAAADVALPASALPEVSVPVIAPVLASAAVEAMASDAEGLLIPVANVSAGALIDTYNQVRGNEKRQHEALDILAPKGTAVFAVADGKVAKLFTSKPGGLTLYQFDVSGTTAYYYAHLERYAPGIAQGQRVKRGDLIGYVGTSGNADPAAPHLHFAIFTLGPKKQWWKGTPNNPYPLLGGK